MYFPVAIGKDGRSHNWLAARFNLQSMRQANGIQRLSEWENDKGIDCYVGGPIHRVHADHVGAIVSGENEVVKVKYVPLPL